MPQFFIDRPIFAWVVAIFISFFGILAIRFMPISQYPIVAPPAITITALYPGASAKEVSETVTSIIENPLNGAKGLLYYESVSDSNGQSQITVTFAPGTNPDLAQVDVQNRVANVAAQLPDVVNQQGLQFQQTGTGFLLIGTLSSTDGALNQPALADYITRNIQNPISRLDGVGQFRLFGAPRAMRIWADTDKLTALGLSTSDLINALKQQNVLISAGSIGSPPNPQEQRTMATVLGNGQLTTPEQFGEIVVRANPDGSSVRLKHVSRIEIGSDNYLLAARLNGKPTAAFAVVLKPTANALDVAKAVEAKMKELTPYFPPNVEFKIPYNTAPYVSTSIEQVIHTLIEAMVLVFLVMYLFLQDFRYTLIPAIVVPVAMLGTFAVMQMFGLTINVLTLFAMVLAIGILVDDAIVVVENVERIMVEEGLSPKAATAKAMPQISGAIVGITAVLTTVFLPLGFMSGSVGVIYRQFAIGMSVSIMFSAFLALSFTPALCATILKPIAKGHHVEKKGFFGWFNRSFKRTTDSYESGVQKILRRGKSVMFIYLLMLGVLAFLYIRMPSSFLPEEDQGYMLANIELPAGASSNRTLDVLQKAEKYYMSDPRVKDLITVTGYSFNGNGINTGLAFITLKDFSERKGRENSAQAVAGKALGALLSGIPDATVFTVVPPAIRELGNATGFDFRLQDRSNLGYESLMAATAQLIGLAMQNPSLAQVRISGLGPSSQLSLKIDREKAAAQGVNFSEAATLLSSAMGAAYIGKFPNMGWMQNVWLQADAKFRMGIEDVLKLNARSASGAMVPLSSFVDVEWKQGPTQVIRYNSYPAIRIAGTSAPGHSTGEAIQQMQDLMSQLPPGFAYEWAGLSYQEKQAGTQAPYLLSLALVVVFLVLCALYESWAIPFSVMLVVPLGMLGAVGLAVALGMSNDVYFQVGMVTVIGLAAKNAILIVEFAKELFASGKSLADASLEASKLRFRPIIMTSFAFILGVLPLTLATGAGSASQRAVGFGVLGGMLAATPFAVLFVPLFFVIVLRFFKTQPKFPGMGGDAK